jgi:hypothetical protein
MDGSAIYAVRVPASRPSQWGIGLRPTEFTYMRVITKSPSIALVIALNLVLFAVVNIVHSRYLPVHVVLYDAIADAFVAAFATVLCLVIWRRHLTIGKWEAGLALAAVLSLGVNYAVLLPTIVDRSLSIGMLEMLSHRGGGIKREAIEDLMFREFFPRYHVVEVRITEQLNSGTIALDGDCIRLTPRGRTIAGFTNWFRTTMLPKHREILGSFGDGLTDPFRDMPTQPSEDCR